jgi:hypothetical protein
MFIDEKETGCEGGEHLKEDEKEDEEEGRKKMRRRETSK